MDHDRDERSDESMLFAFTPLRRVGSRESPYAGTLVRSSAGIHVLVDPDQVPSAEVFWTPREDAHVLRAVDVVHVGRSLTDSGPGALIHACREPLESYLAAGAEGVTPWGPSECATVMVSILRAAVEMKDAEARSMTGRWWLTATARPVFAVTAAGEDVRVSGRRILAGLPLQESEGWGIRDTLDALLTTADLRADEVDACERALFDWAQPGPLRPLGDRTVSARPAAAPAMTADEEAPTEPVGHRGVDGLLRAADAGWASALSDARGSLRMLWDRYRPPRGIRQTRSRPRRGRLIALTLVAGIALAVTVVIALPSSGQTTVAVPATVESSPPAADDGGEVAGGTDSRSITRTVGELLDAWATCSGDALCLQSVSERPDLIIGAGAASVHRSMRDLELVDEYGDVAVVRADAEGAGPQLVIVARHDERWLLREVLDLSQQPSS